MKNPKLFTRTALAVALAILITACATLSGVPVQTLRGADIPIADQAPVEKAYLGKRPGTAGQEKVARTFQQQPPLIPHTLTNFDEITLENNDCLTCHGQDAYEKKKAPKMADSHFRDRSGKQLTTLASTRYQCTQCHVPQVDASPLVESTFRSVPVQAPANK